MQKNIFITKAFDLNKRFFSSFCIQYYVYSNSQCWAIVTVFATTRMSEGQNLPIPEKEMCYLIRLRK